jgi:hypothetical protein
MFFAFQDEDVVSTQYFKRWCQFGAFSGGRDLLATRQWGLGEVDDNRYMSAQEIVNPVSRFALELNSHTRVDAHTTDLSKALPSRRNIRVPDQPICHYGFASDCSSVGSPEGSLNLSQIDNVVHRYTLRQSPATGRTREHIGQLQPSSIPLGDGVPAQKTTGGTIYLYHRTCNAYKQAMGQIGKLYAS